MVQYFKTYSALITVVVIVVIGTPFYFLTKDSGPDIDFVIAEREDLIQEVNVTGRVVASESVDLAFEGSGRVSKVRKVVGDEVSRGDLLVELENSEKKANLAQAKAIVKLHTAKLQELTTGYTQEEIDVQEVKVRNAEFSLTEAKRNMVVKINDAFTKSDDAVRNNIDQFVDDPRSNNPQISFPITDSSLEISVESSRVAIEVLLNEWATVLSLLTIESDLSIAAAVAKNNLMIVREFLDNISLAVNSLSASTSFSQATIDGYRSDVSIARSAVNTALSNVSTAEEKLQTAESALALASQELTLKTAGTRVEQITAQKAKIEEAESVVESSQALLDKTYLFAPISGVVTKQESKVGEVVSANEILVNIISQAELEIESNVPEADIAKITLGDKAKVTLDAYGNTVEFTVHVVSIDPAETVIEGVATYKTVLHFMGKDDRVRPGMTANIDIKTADVQDAISIPSRAVITKNGRRVVRILDDDNAVVEVMVTTGLRSSDGKIEVMSGVQEGDRVIIFIEE